MILCINILYNLLIIYAGQKILMYEYRQTIGTSDVTLTIYIIQLGYYIKYTYNECTFFKFFLIFMLNLMNIKKK